MYSSNPTPQFPSSSSTNNPWGAHAPQQQSLVASSSSRYPQQQQQQQQQPQLYQQQQYQQQQPQKLYPDLPVANPQTGLNPYYSQPAYPQQAVNRGSSGIPSQQMSVQHQQQLISRPSQMSTTVQQSASSTQQVVSTSNAVAHPSSSSTVVKPTTTTSTETAPTSSNPESGSDEEERTLFGPLRMAKDRVDGAMRADEEAIPPLDTMLGSVGGGSAGGASNMQSGQYNPPEPWELDAFRQVRQIDLPEALFAEMKKTGIRAKQGLLSDIQRAWFVLDGMLLLWDYNHEPNRLDRCEHQAGSQVDCVGLVKANKEIFSSEIDYLLVVCGDAAVSVLGVSYNPVTSAVKLINTGVVVPLNGRTRMMQVTGTSTSRIFLLGDRENGCIYELKYNVSGWSSYLGMGNLQHYLENVSTSSALGKLLPSFSSFASGGGGTAAYRQILVDSHRGHLYALTERGGIELWSIPRDGSKLTRIHVLDDPLVQARQMTFGSGHLEPAKLVRVVSISLVGSEESKNYQLVAITNTAVRLYMTTSPRSYYGAYMAYNASNSLATLHVRLPPLEVAQVLQKIVKSGVQSNTRQDAIVSHYFSGVFAFALNSPADNQSTILLSIINPVQAISFVARRNENSQTTMSETFAASARDGTVYDIAEEPSELSDNRRLSSANRRISSGSDFVVGELISQITVQKPRTFVLLSWDGIQIYTRTTPLETLSNLLTNRMSRDGLTVWSQQFNVNPGQLCAMDIAIACQNLDSVGQAALEHLNNFSQQLARFQSAYPGSQKYSSSKLGLDALSIHVSRILRGVWRSNVTMPGMIPNTLDSNFSSATLKGVQRSLQQVADIVKNNSTALGIADEPSMASKEVYDPNAEDRESLKTLQLLLDQTIEAISFVLLLMDFKLPTIVGRAEPAAQEYLRGLTYQGLITTKNGREVAKMLVTTLINMQTGQQSSIESISNTLQQRCGSFCRPEDVILYKAWENIRKAKEARSRPDRDEYLHDAFELFERGASAISLDKAKETCVDFRRLGYAYGAINLPLLIAERKDPEHVAYGYYSEGQPKDDPRAAAYQIRIGYYDVAIQSLAVVDDMVAQETQTDGPRADTLRMRDDFYEIAYKADDDLFLMYLYDWLVKEGRRDQLLELERDDSVEMYLRHRPPSQGDQDLLWRFYARRGRHYMAALALKELADSPNSNLPLNQRVESLALATLHAKSSSTEASERAPVDFVTELEEQTDVANIQMEIWQAIVNASDVPDDIKASKVADLENGGLRDISELWSEFAFPLNLLEMMLVILKVSDHRDVELVAEIWETLFERAMEEAGSDKAEVQFVQLKELVERLGKKLYPSGAFPTSNIISFLLAKGLEAQGRLAAGSVFTVLKNARVGYYDIWSGITGVRDEGSPPFDTESAQLYLDQELAVFLSSWIKDVRSSTLGGNNPSSSSSIVQNTSIPAAEVDDFINGWLLEHKTVSRGGSMNVEEVEKVKKAFQEVRKEIRTAF